MRQQRWNLGNETIRRNFDEYITNTILSGKKALVEIVEEGRTLPQNAKFYSLYSQVAKQKGDESADEIKAYCKYHFGLSIVCAADPEYAALLKNAIRSDLSYEIRLELVNKLPVTSLMDTQQGSEYIDRIIRHYSQQGLCLLHPSEIFQ